MLVEDIVKIKAFTEKNFNIKDNFNFRYDLNSNKTRMFIELKNGTIIGELRIDKILEFINRFKGN